MKTFFKWLVILITSLIFLYAFSSSYTSEDIDHLDYVIALAIDEIPESTNFQISFEFADISSFSEDSSSKDSKPIINSVVAPSISSAINIMNAYIGKQLSLSHCKVIIISDSVAKKGLLEPVSDLMNNTQIRPTANIIIAKDSATSYIENSISSLEQILTKYYDVFPTSSEYTGYTSNIILGEFYDNIINSDIGAVAIYGQTSSSTKKSNSSEDTSSSNESSNSEKSSNETSNSDNSNTQYEESIKNNITNKNSSEESNTLTSSTLQNIESNEYLIYGDRGTENIGLAVFKDDIYLGNLGSLDTLCHCLLKNEVDNFLVIIDNPINTEKKINISLNTISNSKISISFENETPIINININLEGKIVTGLDDIDLSSTYNLEQININLCNYITTLFENYLNKTSTEYQVDIDGFYKVAKKKFLTMNDFENYNWKEKYTKSDFKININSDIISGLLLQDT